MGVFPHFQFVRSRIKVHLSPRGNRRKIRRTILLMSKVKPVKNRQTLRYDDSSLTSDLKAEATWVRFIVLTTNRAWIIWPRQSRRHLCQSKKWDRIARNSLMCFIVPRCLNNNEIWSLFSEFFPSTYFFVQYRAISMGGTNMELRKNTPFIQNPPTQLLIWR